ncbi:MAG: ISAzo13 family transposase [Candidatus Subteraquimicrobiales bacterium]|nr:ISAzo13 family transposase [Candidatus Subteraquimicrobiales bacterium]
MQSDILIKEKYKSILPLLGERERRIVLAADAKSMGRGGLSKVSKLSGVSRVTLNAGMQDLSQNPWEVIDIKKSRRPGGGRKKATEKDSTLAQVIEEIVSPHTMGDPMKPLLWTSKSLRKISAIAKERGYNVSHKLVGELLKELGYTLQSNRKTDEGGKHEDRDAQFEHINKIAATFLAANHPVISVDCKKKEVLGNIKNAGRDWLPSKEPTKVKVYDFIDKELGKAIPYGVYDVGNNEGWVSVGINNDTASFAVATIRSWWYEMGREKNNSDKLFITADGGGSNSSRSKLWKRELQLFANETGLEILVSHYPPGTSKWNKIEHRLFSYISMNWKAKPLINVQFVVDLIAATTTSKGLRVKAKLDSSFYEKGIQVSDKELAQLNITKDTFHGEWNYKIIPIIV